MAPNKLDREESLQAVVLTDSYNERFMPITLEMPRCLLPIANTPVIDYTLEFLAVAGVQEIFVLCTSHAEQIKDHLRQSKWSKPQSPVKLHPIILPECSSTGDALRELDSMSLITSDFILVHGDLISNMKLERVLEEHKTRRKVDKQAIMTMVLKKASPEHRSRIGAEDAMFVLASEKQQILHYEVVEPYPPKAKLSFDVDLLKKRIEVEINNGLLDCQVDICSPDVPALFTENFDYQELRKDFVRGILQSDLLGMSIHYHILIDEYAARVRNTKMYDAISKDLVGRWIFPMVPDSNLQENDSYQFHRGFVYKENNVILARCAELQSKVVVGSGTTIGENTLIRNSVIGRNCDIGSNVQIDGGYIWDNVKIESDCSINQSIIANNAIIKQGTTVSKGCLISYNVIVNADTVLAPFTKLYVAANADSEEQLQLGEATEWKDDEEDDDEVDPRNKQMWSIGSEIVKPDVDSDEESGEEPDSDGEDNFVMELEATIERAIAEDHALEIAALELNTLKMAYDGSFGDIRQVITPRIIRLLESSKDLSFIKEIVEKWGPLISKFTFSDEDYVEILDIVAQVFMDEGREGTQFQGLIRCFYELDIIDEESLIQWFDKSDGFKILKKGIAPFIEWLQEEEEDEDEDENDSEED